MADRIDIESYITDVVQPQVQDEVVNKSMDQLNALFTRNTDYKSGVNITDTQTLTRTAAGGAYTRNDADPASLTETYSQPYWKKVYYHEAVNIRREDVDESLAPSAFTNLVTMGIESATKELMEHVFDGVMTQIKADVDATGTYGSQTRVTATASYEEATDATITLAYLRGAQKAIALKRQINWMDYVWLLEQTVMNTAQPLMSATGSWIENNPRIGGNMSNTGMSGGVASGYLPVASFDGIAIPPSPYGMTVGDCLLLNRNDVQIQEHKSYEVQIKDPDEYAFRAVVRIGVNAWVRHPAWQAKMTSKD